VTTCQDDGQQMTRCTLRREEQGKAGAVCTLSGPVACDGTTAEQAAARRAGAVVGVAGTLQGRPRPTGPASS
jgi:hypothetical protein